MNIICSFAYQIFFNSQKQQKNECTRINPTAI